MQYIHLKTDHSYAGLPKGDLNSEALTSVQQTLMQIALSAGVYVVVPEPTPDPIPMGRGSAKKVNKSTFEREDVKDESAGKDQSDQVNPE